MRLKPLCCLLASLAAVQAASSPCSTEETPSFRIGGTHSVLTLVSAWRDAYLESATTECDVDIHFEVYGNDPGQAQVCGNHPIYASADIAGLSLPFYFPTASTTNGWSFDCKFGSERKTTLIKIGYEGIAVIIASNGIAAQCLSKLGGSLSEDQLRWMYSSYTMKQLISGGMDPQAVPFWNQDDSTHLWAELNENCTDEEIQVAWVDLQQDAYQFLDDRIFTGMGETMDTQRGNVHAFQQLDTIADYLENHTEAVAIIEIGNLASHELISRAGTVAPVPIAGAVPSADAFESQTYPLSQKVYLGVWNDHSMLTLMTPFLEFALSDKGFEIMADTGMWAIDEWERIVLKTQLGLTGGVSMESIQASCGPVSGNITIAGSVAAFPVERIFSQVYKLGCPTVNFVIDQGGSSAGAARVCANKMKGEPVDVGSMTRAWETQEGLSQSTTPYVYHCKVGDQTRSTIQVDLAKDGISVIVKKGGIADDCQQLLGGFTTDQLRWIYSSYSEEELERTGWDPASVPNSDDDPTTHLWSELDSRCAPQEIQITGAVLNEGTHEHFRDVIMKDSQGGEDISLKRPEGYFQSLGLDLVTYLQKHSEAISYIGYYYFHNNRELLSAAPIKNSKGAYVTPSPKSISDGSYHPLVRTVFLNIWNNPSALKDVVPWLRFGYNHPELVTATGMVPVQGDSLKEMLRRLNGAKGGPDETSSTRQRNLLAVVYMAAMVLLVNVF